MLEKNLIKVAFMNEKKEGHGEDAPPLLIVSGKACAVGVFDGMGGAGAATCESDFGEGYTKAYVASRIVASAVQVCLDNHLPTIDITVNDLEAVIKRTLEEEQDKYPSTTKSMLRSKLVRDYPTTMALVVLSEIESGLSVDSYWAGDSHCYFWNRDGFFLISEDDLEQANDPMENLHNDSPISNCICADRDFTIHHQHIELPKSPIVILTATDGCFGYYPSPMHFEDALKSTLAESQNAQEWKLLLENKITEIAGDDTSLSLIGFGFDSFKEIKKMGASPAPGIKRIKVAEEELRLSKEMLIEATNGYELSLKKGWAEYKEEYMRYLKDDSNGNVEG